MTEDYVSFEMAKLLKEKGFDGKCYKVWETNSYGEPNLVAAPHFVEGETCVDMESVSSAEKYYNDMTENNHIEGFLAPTLQMAMNWLLDTYKLHIVPTPYPHEDGEFYWAYKITFLDSDTLAVMVVKQKAGFDSKENACEGAIKYCLENLI